jgi:thiosulfate dehydrogenase
MRNFLLGILIGAAILTLCVMLDLRLGFAEVRADLPPSSFENSFMTAAVHASVRREAPEMPKPVASTDENLIAGGKLFNAGCAGCHGAFGKPEDDSDSLFPPVLQLHKVGTQYTEAPNMTVAALECLSTEMVL